MAAAFRPVKLRTRPPSDALKVVTFLGFGFVAFAVVAFIGECMDWPPKEEAMAGCAMFAFWGSIIGGFGWKSIRHGINTHLVIDPGRGTATLVEEQRTVAAAPLGEVGELAIESKEGDGTSWYWLVASGMPGAKLFGATTLFPVEQRRVLVERLVGEHAIRQLIAHDAPDDAGAFRNDPDLAFRARKLVPNDIRLREVLDALERDAELAAKVAALRTMLASGPA